MKIEQKMCLPRNMFIAQKNLFFQKNFNISHEVRSDFLFFFFKKKKFSYKVTGGNMTIISFYDHEVLRNIQKQFERRFLL